MSFLTDGLPDSVDVGGRRLKISTGYREGLRYERLLRSKKSDEEKLTGALAIYFPRQEIADRDLPAAVDALVWFYRCGAAEPTEEEVAEAEEEARKPKCFDIEHDAGYVYAAFRQAYHIDLIENNIHWWQFRALFESLPDDVKLIKVIGYRTAEVPEKASKEQRQEIERLKRVYALPEDPDQKKLKSDLEKALRNGGNIAAFIKGVQQNGIRRDAKI